MQKLTLGFVEIYVIEKARRHYFLVMILKHLTQVAKRLPIQKDSAIESTDCVWLLIFKLSW